jgi:Carboxypeptidase regulatory-like domain
MRVIPATAALAGLLLPVRAAAQAPLLGTVRDAQSGRPLEGVEVAIERWDLTTRTDSAGHYRLVLPGGAYELQARRVGYLPEARLLTVVVRDSIHLDLALSPAPQMLPDLVTAAESRNRFRAPIEERMREGFGHFLTEDLLRKSEDRRFTSLLQTAAPGLFIQHTGSRAVAGAAARWRYGSMGSGFSRRTCSVAQFRHPTSTNGSPVIFRWWRSTPDRVRPRSSIRPPGPRAARCCSGPGSAETRAIPRPAAPARPGSASAPSGREWR